MSIKPITADLNLCKCERCGHEWTSRKGSPPVRCAKCRGKYWNKPKTRPVKGGEL